jgi:hypothetical protein
VAEEEEAARTAGRHESRRVVAENKAQRKNSWLMSTTPTRSALENAQVPAVAPVEVDQRLGIRAFGVETIRRHLRTLTVNATLLPILSQVLMGDYRNGSSGGCPKHVYEAAMLHKHIFHHTLQKRCRGTHAEPLIMHVTISIRFDRPIATCSLVQDVANSTPACRIHSRDHILRALDLQATSKNSRQQNR